MNNKTFEITIQSLFEEQVAKTPNNLSVQYKDFHLTYNELNEKSNQLAHYLKRNGIQAEDKIAIYFERSLDMIIGILGILKSGACYVPIDIKSPLHRVSLILEDVQPVMVLTNNDKTKHWHNATENIVNINVFSQFDIEPVLNPKNVNKENDLAYIIYTSGSTGRPKGVMVEHRNSISFLKWAKAKYKLSDNDVMVAFSPIMFDLSIFEIFTTLISGAKLIIADKPYDLFEEKLLNEVTILSTVPSAFKSITAFKRFFEEKFEIPRLKQFNFAGESLDIELVNQVYKYLKPKIVYNCYGPTETTTYATVFPIKKNYKGKVYIGNEIGPTKIFILDENFNEVPTGQLGNIFIAGDCVTRGYLNLPNDTNEKFLYLPQFSVSKIYKSGDIGKRDFSGNIEYLGRHDHQVKIKGHRIELGEIEVALLKYPEILNVCVLPIELKDQNTTLIAFFVAEKTISISDIQRFLKNILPIYMLPTIYKSLNNLPLTLSGKLDRAAMMNTL